MEDETVIEEIVDVRVSVSVIVVDDLATFPSKID